MSRSEEPEQDKMIAETQETPLRLGTRDREDGGGRIGFLRVGEYDLEVDAEQADELSASLRAIAVELRNGGRLS